MIAKRIVLLYLLKLTKNGPVSKLTLTKAARLPVQVVEAALLEFSQVSLFEEHQDIIETSPSQRLRLAVTALQLGADFEVICRLLSWAEFEGIASEVFGANGYRVIRNFRFRNGGKRWEIDILALQKPAILCVDCKHWARGLRSAAAAKIVEAQIERTSALAKMLPHYRETMETEHWHTAKLTPLILSLFQGSQKFHFNVPIVPILKLQDFMNEALLEGDLLLSIVKNLDEPKNESTSYAKKPHGKRRQTTLI